VPFVVWWLVVPRSRIGERIDRWAITIGLGVFVFVCLFTAVAEHLFWTEFSTRFNFIAVDYLIYTNEVIGNIWQSYPVGKLIAVLIAVTIAIAYATRRWLTRPLDHVSISRRLAPALVALALPAVLIVATPTSLADATANAYGKELSLNGIWALFHAFFNNEIEYRRFYRTLDDDAVAKRIDRLLVEKDASIAPAGDHLTRIIRRSGPMLRKNIMLISMESMSADYMARFGSTHGVTPNLDRLAGEGLLFTRLLATGNRTVRGLEALTLSVPPTPGQSILRRPGNGGLFTVGDVLRDRGYDTRFIYGGYGYFDNMNAFYAGNGFEVVDRTLFGKDEIRFENVWGVSDEDLFARSLKEADKSHAAGRPFFQLVMTTSNHRPFTYPDGVIDIHSKSGRLGGVKYADYAVGRLIEAARAKPWFADTVFVFVADHTSGTSGKIELDPAHYHIPLIFYAPGFISPGTYDKLASQIDVMPVLLGLLNTSYVSRFFGRDVLNDPAAEPRAFIGNYQKVALVRGGTTLVLGPKQTVEGYRGLTSEKTADLDPEMIADAVAYYQFASDWARRSRRIDTRLNHD
jgi:phosphoglycerol transferase MdoB-like AlkP superfamily enzyme